MDNTQTMYPASAPIPDGGAQTSADDASASTMYGTPVGSTMVHTSQRGGPGMPVGGKQANPYGLVSPKTSPAAHPQFPQQDIPNIADYIQMRAAEDKKTTLSSLTPDEILGYTDEYANHFGVASYESQGNKMDKSQADALVARAKMSVTKNMPALKAHFANIDNAGKAAAPTAPSALDSAGAAVKDAVGATGDVSYPSGAGYALDNPLTRGLAQAGNAALTGVEHAAAHPVATAEGVANTLIGLTPVGKLLQTAHPEVTQWLTQNRDDPAVANFVDKNFHNPATGASFQKEGEDLAIPKNANPLEAGAQFGANLGGQLAIAGAGGELATGFKGVAAANALKAAPKAVETANAVAAAKAAAPASKLGAAATFGATSGENQIAQKEAQTGKPIPAAQQGDMIMSAVATGALPASVGGSLIRRLISGAAIGTGANALSNAAAGNSLAQGAGTAALLGAGFGALPHGEGATPKPNATPEAKPGETPPPVAGAAPAKPVEGQSPHFENVYQSVVKDPEYVIKPTDTPEAANAKIAEAAYQFTTRLASLDENMTPAQEAAAPLQFEQRMREQFGLPDPNAPAAPAAEAKPPVQEGQAPSPAEAAAAVATPAEGASEPPNAAETPPVEPGIEPGAAREAAQEGVLSHGEVREAAPAAEPVPLRELVTQNGVDTRLPFGVTERVATELRASLGRDPTPQEINTHAKMILDTAGVDLANLHKREALGKLLEEDGGKIPTREEIAAKADEMKDDLKKGSAQKAVTSRIVEFQNRKAAREINKSDLRVTPKQKELPLGPPGEKLELTHGLRDDEVDLLRGDKAKEKAATDKAKADNAQMRAEREKAVAEEAKKQGLRDVLKKTEPKKAEAANQEGEAAQEDTNKEQPAFYRVRKAGTKDKFGEPVTGRSRADIQDELTNGVPGKIKGLGKEVVTALQKRFVKVVQSMDQLPQEAIDEYNKHPEAGAVKGYYDPKNDVSYLVADHLEPGEAIPTIIHEVGAHYGLRRMLLPSTYNALERYVEATRHLDTPDGRELAKAYADAQAAQVHPKNAINETMATMITNRGTQAGSIWARALAQLKAFLYNKLGHILPEKWADKLINNDTIMELARGALKWTSNKDMNVALRHTEEPIVDHPGMFSRRATGSAAEISHNWSPANTPAHEAAAPSDAKSTDFVTKNINELYPLQRLNRLMEKAKVKIDSAKDMFMAMTNLGGQVRHEVNHDIANYAEPAKNEFMRTALELGFKGQKGFREFIGHATDAIAGRHALDVNKLMHYMQSRLSPEAEALRKPLLADVFADKMDPKEWMPKLKEIVNAPGALIEKGGKRMGSGIDDVKANKLIEMARKAGITDDVAQRLNSVLDPIRQRTLEQGVKSGNYTPEQQRIVQAYGSKWYVPFKGYAEELPTGLDNTRRPNGAFNKDTTAAREGRTTQAKSPLESLFSDLTNSGKDVAYRQAAQTIFKAVSDPKINEKLGGVKVKTYDINKLTADALKGGGKLSDMDNIFRDPNTIIYKNGKDWHVMQFPEGSKELQAIKSIEADKSLSGLSAAAGHVTNYLARAKTSFSPVFTLYSALARDTTGYPILAAADHGPKIAADYVVNLAKFGGPFGAWKTYSNFFKGVNDFGAMEKMAQENPNSFAGWAYRLSKSGGGLDFKSEINNFRTGAGLAETMAKDSRSAWNPLKAISKGVEFLDSLATSSIATGRVSMFKSLVESGKSDLEAGHYVKRMENFEQTSEGSRQMNAWFPFWRAGIANANRMYDLVHKPDGSFDKAKFGKLAAVGVAAAAAYWNLVLKQYYGDDAKKLKLSTLSQNFVLPNPTGGDPIKIPMGLGLPRLMLGLGIIAARAADGSASKEEVYEATKQTLFENLSPLKPSEGKQGGTVGDKALDLLSAAVPGAGRAPLDLARNQSSLTGRDIYGTPNPHDNRFAADSGFRSTPAEWKELAQGVQKHLGMDVHPESLEYLANSYGQGYLTELLRSFSLESKQAAGTANVTDYPFVPRFTTGDIRYAPSDEFHGQALRLQDAVKQVNALKADNKPVPPALQKQEAEESKFSSASREHSKDLKAVEDNKLLSAAGKASQMAAINSKYQRTQEQLAGEAKRISQ